MKELICTACRSASDTAKEGEVCKSCEQGVMEWSEGFPSYSGWRAVVLLAVLIAVVIAWQANS